MDKSPTSLRVQKLQSGEWAVTTAFDVDGFASIIARCPTELEANEARFPGTVAAALYRTDRMTLDTDGEVLVSIRLDALKALKAAAQS